MRKPLMAGNWKMNLNHFEAIQTVQKLHYLLPKEIFEQVDVTVHVPFTDIRSVQTLIDSEELDLILGAQHISSDYRQCAHSPHPLLLSKIDLYLEH